MDDLISRQAAIKALENCELGEEVFMIKNLPSAQPDLSEYSDKLWRNAYERGKAEAQTEIIHCRECKHGKWDIFDRGMWCELHPSLDVTEEDFCSRAERGTDE